MSDDSGARIEFPCAYPIKVMGLDENGFAESVLEIVRRHDPALDATTIAYRPSRNGKYLSVNVTITATSAAHIQALFDELKASGRVAMVL